MNFETLLKQIVKEAVVEALSEVEPKNWTTNDIHEEPHNQEPSVEVEEVEVEEPETVDTEVDLGSMKLKELREYAEELGLNSKGKRAELEARIQEFLENADEEEPEEEPEEDLGEEPEADETETENEETEDEVDDTEEDEEEDETYAKVMEYVNEASDEELRETLEELGLSSKGKREALIEKIYQAVKDGLFEFEEEDEEPSEDTEEEGEEETSEDLGMTEARLKAIEAMEEQVQEEFEEGKITRKEMVAYLKQVGIAVTKKVEDEAVVEMYTEKLALLIDDEGEFHDEGGDPYNINEVPYCCGAPLEEIEGGYRCNVCGTEYEAE
nr:MAG TPA: putative DNA-binding motif protein [Caudoviricetes sp.]